jgi:hypothetical protein
MGSTGRPRPRGLQACLEVHGCLDNLLLQVSRIWDTTRPISCPDFIFITMNAANQPWLKAACAMPSSSTVLEQDDPNLPNVPGDLARLCGQRVASSPYLSSLLEDETRNVASMIEDGRVQLPPRRCLGAVTSASATDQQPPAASTVHSDAGVPPGATLYFTPVCVMDQNTKEPICALYCLNIHRVFIQQGEAGGMVDLSPTAFEVLGGRAANRKWRVSLKVVSMTTEGGMIIHMGLGKWLDVSGLNIWLPEEVRIHAFSPLGADPPTLDRLLASSPPRFLPCPSLPHFVRSPIYSPLLQAMSRVGSKQSSRNSTPAGSPVKRTRSTHTRAALLSGVVEDFDVLLDVVTRPARAVTSGQIMWGLCARPASMTGATAQNQAARGADEHPGYQDTLDCNWNARKNRLEEDQDGSGGDNGLIYLPSHMPSSGST